MERVASEADRVRAFTAADLRAVAAAVEQATRAAVGGPADGDDVLRAVDGLVPAHALSLWLPGGAAAALDVGGHVDPARLSRVPAPVHVARDGAQALARALLVVGRRGRHDFALVAWRRLSDPSFDARERALLDAVGPAVAGALDGRARVRATTGRALLDALARALEAPPRSAPAPNGGLTAREERVAALVALGRSNAEVAFELGLSEHTIKQHLKSIFRKLAVRGRTELALRLAREQGRS